MLRFSNQNDFDFLFVLFFLKMKDKMKKMKK